MKILLLSTVLWSALAGGDRERGMQLYQAGKFEEAQSAFAAALLDEPESAELQWNLALAAWRAGDLATAEVAAEKYAALAKGRRGELHRGMLGAIRFAEAEELESQAKLAMAAAQQPPAQGAPSGDEETKRPQPLDILKEALKKAEQAKEHFVRGVRQSRTPELLRNTERTLRKIDELKRLIEELEKQQDQEQQDGDQNQDDQKPEDGGEDSEKKDSGDEQGEDQKSQDQSGDENQEGDQKQNGEKKDPGEQQQPENGKPDEQNGESDPGDPGEGDDPLQSPEPNPDEEPGEEEQGEPSSEQGNQDEPKDPEGQAPAAPEPGDQKEQSSDEQLPQPPEPQPGEQRSDAPGEAGQGLELSPEQAQRLMERAKKLDEQLKKAKARTTARRKAVERDW